MTLVKRILLSFILGWPILCILSQTNVFAVSHSNGGPHYDKYTELNVNCDQEIGPLSTLWRPSISFRGLGAEKNYIGHASKRVIEDYASEIGLEGGVFGVHLHLWKMEDRAGSIDNYDFYLRTIRENGGIPFIRLVGTPAYLLDSTFVEENPTRYMGYPPEDLEGWKDLIYDVLKYIVIPDDSIIDPHLFAGDSTPKPTLGLGDNIFFSFLNGIWGPDNFQFRGTEEELLTQWNYTVQAVYQLEADYPGIDIQLGGMGWNTGLETNFFERGGLIEDWINYSRENNLTIDLVDFAYRSNLPFGLSRPTHTDYVGCIRTYLEENGYDPQTPVMAVQWESINSVEGANSARGYPIIGAELQSHIMAALVPTRLYDMELAGQKYQFREAIQDFNSGNYPLYIDTLEGQNSGYGIYTIGTEQEGWYGLRKPEFNAWKMISMLKDTRVEAQSSAASSNDYQSTFNIIATKDSATGDIGILIWYYVYPNLLGARPDYSELLSSFPIMSSQLFINGLQAGSSYIIDKYSLSATTGNSFTNRNEIYEALQQNTPLALINQLNLVNMESLSEEYHAVGDTMTEYITMEPYSLLFISIRKDDLTGTGEGGDSPGINKPVEGGQPLEISQNYPNPFNPTTVIRFSVNIANERKGTDNSGAGTEVIPVRLEIYDLRGRLIKELLNEKLETGEYSVSWNGRDSMNQPVPSGVYLYAISTGNYRAIKKMVLLK
jgi:hypothetical protein